MLYFCLFFCFLFYIIIFFFWGDVFVCFLFCFCLLVCSCFFFFLFVCFLLFFFSWLNFYFIIWISSTKTIVKANRNALQTIHYMLNIEYIIYVYIHKHGHYVKIFDLFVSILTFHTMLYLIQIRNQFLTQKIFIFMPLHTTFVIWALFLSRQYLVSLSIRYFMLALFT